MYDHTGVMGFTYQGQTYFYQKDLQGNIFAIVNAAGVAVAFYHYDAWGNHKVYDADSLIEMTSPTFIGNLNPFRYRGYYYDTETKLYYLQSRYYDPEVGRFISADQVEYTTPEAFDGLNIYAYCNNNPVMFVDPNGHVPILSIILGITALIGLGLTIGGVASKNNTLTAIGLGFIGVASLISGGIAFVGGIATGATLTAIVGGVTSTAGIFSLGFMSAEIQESTQNGNWIMDSTGMSDNLYNSLLLTSASIASLGTIASSISSAFNIKSIFEVAKYGNYYGMRFKTGAGKIRVLSFHTHGHKVAKGIKSIGEWHWQLTKWDPYAQNTAGTIARWIWWNLTRF